MTQDPHALIDALEGRAWEIAHTIRHEVKAAAPYAEAGIAFGRPTWFLHDRVVSIVALGDRCKLYFWQGAALEKRLGERMRGGGSEIRYLVLESIFDVDDRVKRVLAEAFQLQIEALASADKVSQRKAPLHA
ncbi:MAG: hypothetical protein AAGA39_10100 [Pseudomonadota bacterium]